MAKAKMQVNRLHGTAGAKNRKLRSEPALVHLPFVFANLHSAGEY